MYRRIFNHFYVISPKANEIGGNNTNYTEGKIMAITPFKIIQGHLFWYKSEAHMQLPINDY